MKKVAGRYAPVAGYLAERMLAISELKDAAIPDYVLHEYNPLLDSSNMRPENWQLIAEDIAAHYGMFDGFVVLHGTDTMAYTASILSFLLDHLAKPVIVTGSQIPLVEVRSDARENLITSMLLAANYAIPEVCVYMNEYLIRGNRSTKVSSTGFDAFDSPNMLPLAEVGVDIELRQGLLRCASQEALSVIKLKDVQVASIRLFPGITAELLENMLLEPIQAVVLETYGAGNAPEDRALLSVLKEASDRGVIIVNTTQCLKGRVDMSGYAAGSGLKRAGVISGFDMTPEAALTKLYYLLSCGLSLQEIKEGMQQNLRGELTL